MYESIRKFAVFCLKNSNVNNLTNYIIQLIQCLKFENYHNSHLAKFLLKTAIKYPLTIGNTLFWCLKSEMDKPAIIQRFGLYLTIFLHKIPTEIRKIFENQIFLINQLNRIADIAFNPDKDKINILLEENLIELNQKMNDMEFSLPYDMKKVFNGVNVKKSKFMKSKKRPLFLSFIGIYNNEFQIIYKKGDDLRQDNLIIQMFKLMHDIWHSNESTSKLKMSNYEVISTGISQGIIQIVPYSNTLADIQKNFGFLGLGSFMDTPLKSWMKKHINISEKNFIDNFLFSCAAYCIATLVFGIGDRHNGNIMIKENVLYILFISYIIMNISLTNLYLFRMEKFFI